MMRNFWMFAAAPVLGAMVLLTSCSSNPKGPSANSPSTSTPSFLYVGSGAEPTMAQPNLTGYAVAANGTLTPLACAPLANSPVFSLVGHGHLLFTSDGDAITVYSIDASGCPTLKSVTNEDINTNLSGCYSNCFAGGPFSLFLDPKSQDLYSWNYLAVDATEFVTYNFDGSGGTVTRIAAAAGGYPPNPAGMLAFSPDGAYAASSSYPLDPSPTGIRVFQRLSDGTLRYLNPASLPAVAQGYTFTPSGAAADSANHFILAGQVKKDPPEAQTISWQLAIYTMDSSGNMTTRSTSENMQAPPSPQPDGELIGYAFSPDSRYFAISDGTGIDVFRWDTTSALLTYLATIASPQPCAQQSCPLFHKFTWDRYDHIIATWGGWIDPSAEIQVYSVSASGITAAPGSPYPLPSANMLTVVGQ